MAGEDEEVDEERLQALHDHLAATAERPLEASANRWLGEAEAVAADALVAEDPVAVRKRVAQVRELLSNVDGTGDEAADRHVDQARSLAEAIDGE
jgi:hypothetical protein